ncbi:MAG TPA: hypothetical protein VFV20_07195 [Candidatus Limnocylindria bacterium]|nr:hypothetical protein [Candidatus Limnocylindria bacterium]
MSADVRARVLAEVAERVALLNEFRTDDFQDQVARLVSGAREHWREGHELPARGADPMLDALLGMSDMADSSPIAVRDACATALVAAGDARVTR